MKELCSHFWSAAAHETIKNHESTNAKKIHPNLNLHDVSSQMNPWMPWILVTLMAPLLHRLLPLAADYEVGGVGTWRLFC